jgi:hypothetical protein
MSIIKKLKKQMEDLESLIEQIQEECSHPEAAQTGVAGQDLSDDPLGTDTRWVTCTCGLCEHVWREDR